MSPGSKASIRKAHRLSIFFESARPDNTRGIPFKVVDSANDETIASFVHREHAASCSGVEQTFRHGITHEFFHSIAHGAGAEFRMETATHQKRENRGIRCEFVSLGFQEHQFLCQ